MFWKKSKNKEQVDNELGFSRNTLLVANWKSNKSPSQTREWLEIFVDNYISQENSDVILASSALALEGAAKYLKSADLKGVQLAAQDVSPFPRGNYTGAVAADMLKEFVEFCVVGHNERRTYFHETQQDVNNKILELTEAGIVPIVCVDKPYAMSQLAVLHDVDHKKIIIAYTPSDPMNFHIPESPGKVAEYVKYLKEFYPGYPVIYGGSVEPHNVAAYLAQEELDGVFVGSACLDAKKFAAFCGQVS